MDINGVWRAKYFKLLLGEPEEINKMQDIEAIMNSGDEEQIENISEVAQMRWIFDDGKYLSAFPIPEGTDMKELEGETVYEDKYVVVDSSTYETVGDTFKLADDGSQQGFSQEDLDAIHTIKVVDGMLEINAVFGMYYLVRE